MTAHSTANANATARPVQRALFEISLVLLPKLFSKPLKSLDFIQNAGLENFVGQAMVVTSVLIATVLLYRRGLRWSHLGLKMPKSVGSLLVWTLVTLVGAIILPNLVLMVLSQYMVVPESDYSALAGIEGNFPLLLLWLTLAWTTVAFGEEMVSRGFLLNRFADLFGGGRLALVIGVIAQAVIFGLAHMYQGPSGVIATGMIGLFNGVIYLASGRSLAPLIIAHGLLDTLGLLSLYYGAGLT